MTEQITWNYNADGFEITFYADCWYTIPFYYLDGLPVELPTARGIYEQGVFNKLKLEVITHIDKLKSFKLYI